MMSDTNSLNQIELENLQPNRYYEVLFTVSNHKGSSETKEIIFKTKGKTPTGVQVAAMSWLRKAGECTSHCSSLNLGFLALSFLILRNL